MKTLKMYSKTAAVMLILVLSLLLCVSTLVRGQSNDSYNNKSKTTLAILSIDTKGITTDAVTVRNMIQLEVEKSNIYSVIDKYDIEDILKPSEQNYLDCFGKTCLVRIGKILEADKMLTGNVERFGDKLVISLRLIDVKTETIEIAEADEFLNLEEELQKMIRISINNLYVVPNKKGTTVGMSMGFNISKRSK